MVSRAVERARGLRLVVLDACRENPFLSADAACGCDAARSGEVSRAWSPPARRWWLMRRRRDGSVGRSGPEQSVQQGAA